VDDQKAHVTMVQELHDECVRNDKLRAQLREVEEGGRSAYSARGDNAPFF